MQFSFPWRPLVNAANEKWYFDKLRFSIAKQAANTAVDIERPQKNRVTTEGEW